MNNPDDKTPNADSERSADVACSADHVLIARLYDLILKHHNQHPAGYRCPVCYTAENMTTLGQAYEALNPPNAPGAAAAAQNSPDTQHGQS